MNDPTSELLRFQVAFYRGEGEILGLGLTSHARAVGPLTSPPPPTRASAPYEPLCAARVKGREHVWAAPSHHAHDLLPAAALALRHRAYGGQVGVAHRPALVTDQLGNLHNRTSARVPTRARSNPRGTERKPRFTTIGGHR